VIDDGNCSGIGIKKSQRLVSKQPKTVVSSTKKDFRNLNGRRIFITKKPALNYSEQAHSF